MIDEENQTEETVETTEPADSSAPADSTGDDTSSETTPEVVSPEITSPEDGTDTDPITGETVGEGAEEAIAPEVVTEGDEAAPATLDDLDIDDTVEDTTDTVPDTTAGVEETASYQAAMTDLMREVEGLRAQLENSTGQYARLSADFENFRKRTQKEREEQAEKIKCDTIRELLAVVDNFERARTLIKQIGRAHV